MERTLSSFIWKKKDVIDNSRILYSGNCRSIIKWSQHAALLVLGAYEQTSSTRDKEKVTLTTNLLIIFNCLKTHVLIPTNTYQ